MRRILRIAIALSAFLLAAAPLAAQAPPENAPGGGAPVQDKPSTEEQGRKIVIQHFRPQDQRGLNVFEAPKEPGVEYTGFKLDFGAAFTSQVQARSSSSTAGSPHGSRSSDPVNSQPSNDPTIQGDSFEPAGWKGDQQACWNVFHAIVRGALLGSLDRWTVGS
jgi:hypothetical protein